MTMKITVFYNENQRGWTETYYTASASLPGDWLTANPPSTWYPLVKYRSVNTYMYGVRASTIGVPRQTSTYVFTGNNILQGAGVTLGGETGPDVSSTDGFVEIYGVNNHKRPLYVRGLNDNDTKILLGGIPAPSAYLAAGLQAHISALRAKQLCVQWQTRPTGGALVYTPVQQVAANPINYTQSTCFVPSAAQLPVTGTELSFLGIPTDDLPGFPRKAVVVGQSSGGGNYSFIIAYRFRASSTPWIPKNLRFVPTTNNYDVISTWTFVEFSERKTGRPIGVPRGRSSPRIRAQ